MGLDTGPKIYRKHGTQPKITSIATNDKDFERLAGVKIWAPL